MSITSDKNSETPDLEKQERMRTIGFIVNPIAGMGGAVGLKGTDGKEILNEALKLGARPVAPVRAKAFLTELSVIETNVRLIVGAGSLGEEEVKDLGLKYRIVGERKSETVAEDTKQTARLIADKHVSLLVFCGGDGT